MTIFKKDSYLCLMKKVVLFLLILLHVLLFNYFFVNRYPPQEAAIQRAAWNENNFSGNVDDYLKLYFSSRSDETYYYQWATFILGKEFSFDDPSPAGLDKDHAKAGENEYGLTNYFHESPKLRRPYRDISFGYPPLMIVPILTSRFLSHNYLEFIRYLALFATLAYFGSLWIMYRIWKEQPQETKFSWNTILATSLLSLFFLGQIYVTHLDVYPSLLYALAVYYFIKERYIFSGVWIVLGTFAKAYSLILAPLFMITLLQNKKYRELVLTSIVSIVLIILLNWMLAWWTEGHYFDTLKLHWDRGIQAESLYSLVPYLAHLIFKSPINIYFSHGSYNIDAASVPFLLKMSKMTPIIVFSSLYFLFWRFIRIKKGDLNQKQILVSTSFFLICAFILTFKVFSPAFLIWLTPLVFIIDVSYKKYFMFFFIFMFFITQCIFPNASRSLLQAQPLGVILLCIRNFLLLGLFIWGTSQLYLKKKEYELNHG
ncbi:MAG: hypothetical protein IPJ69_14305 [Deltaproteobacteria bacterium]|nr:MAG: hypothetical protein IPJ69_14305 [Deltaproteobacteria bacterium]